MYVVLENGKPCDYKNHKVHESWDKSTHETLKEAIDYFDRWFYPFCSWKGNSMEVNEPKQYYEGCLAEIRYVK